MPDYFTNMDVLMSFKSVGIRLLQYRGSRLAFLAKYLDQFDKQREEDGHTRGLTDYQKRLPGELVDKGDYDTLVSAVEEEYLVYTQLASRCHEMHRLHPLPRPLFKDYLSYILKKKMLDENGLIWMKIPDEAVCISKPLSETMAWLTHTRPGKWLIKQLPTPEGTDSDERFVPNWVLVVFHKALITLGALAVLVPIGIMFLCHLTPAQNFGVVVGFSVLFSLPLSLSQEVDSYKAWLVVCGFAAVLVTVMVQLVGVAPSS
ncbi:hypothetical protein QBC47DRAFT_408737 [Echria macrotheca]|uniref:DUF6594 domain-containing protein n=1 Tax=Echria macrotheca TaxID=438768 RepID=A0AAJ0FH23_9PEZI|nr:hypothetical protein QBC47DRAFT_408737 [Echria macrotheca]